MPQRCMAETYVGLTVWKFVVSPRLIRIAPPCADIITIVYSLHGLFNFFHAQSNQRNSTNDKSDKHAQYTCNSKELEHIFMHRATELLSAK